MKFFAVFSFIVVLLVCAAGNAQAENDFLKAILKPCQEKEGASDKDVIALSNKSKPETPEGKCLIACLGEQFGFMNKDNELSKDVFVGFVVAALGEEKRDKVEEVADICLEVSDEERCESSFLIWQCVEEESRKNGFEWH